MKLALISLDKNNNPHLGLASIATYMRQTKPLVEPYIIDSNFDDILLKVGSTNPDIIGISCFTNDYAKAIALAGQLKKRKVPIIVGGPHISTLPRSLHRNFDIGVIGEGEEIISELIDIYDKYGKFPSSSLRNVKGIVFSEGSELIVTEKRDPISPLDKIPIIDKSFFNKAYFLPMEQPVLNGEEVVSWSILTSRGCPYKCVFCSTTRFWDKLRFNSVDRVFNEIMELYSEYNVRHISILDDLFVADKTRLINLVERIEKAGLNKTISFFCQLRANLVDEQVLMLLKRMNVKSISFGFESGSQKILSYLKKNSVTVEQNKNSIRIGKKLGFIVSGSIIFGTPGETVEDMKKTIAFIDFAKKHGVDRISSYILAPLPATEIWSIAESKGLVSTNMEWGRLFSQDIKDFIYINDALEFSKFKKYFMKARKKLQYYKYAAILNMVKNDPWGLLIKILKNPLKAIRLFFKPLVYT